MKKVLITDDEQRIVRLIRGMIDWEQLGLELSGEASDGLAALDIMREKGADILIVDIKMPGMDGFSLVSLARELNPNLAVIIISGYKEFDYAYQALKNGICDYLLKPVNKNDLNASLRKILNVQQPESASLKEELWRYRRQHIVSNCVFGIADIPSSIETFNQEYGFHFQEGIFAALTVALAIPDSSLHLEAALGKTGDIIQIELSPICTDFEYTRFQNYCCCIYNFPPSSKSLLLAAIQNLKRTLDSRIGGILGIPVIMASSSFQENLYQIPHCCSQAMLCCKSSCVLNKDNVIFADDIHLGQPYSILTPRSAEIFRNVVSQFDADILSQHTTALFSSLKPLLLQQPWQLEYFLREMVTIFQKETAREHIFIDSEEIEELLHMLIFMPDYNRLLDKLIDWFTQKIQLYYQSMSEHLRKPIRMARQYIEQHYMEQLSLTDISEAVGFSYNYFSTLFKQETGQNIIDYITQVRIEHAKELLATTRYSIQKIANQTGYLDSKHFNKIFLRQVGIRPTEYRKLKS